MQGQITKISFTLLLTLYISRKSICFSISTSYLLKNNLRIFKLLKHLKSFYFKILTLKKFNLKQMKIKYIEA